MSFMERLGEVFGAIRAARLPKRPTSKPHDESAYTGERALVRSWMKESERVSNERREGRDHPSGRG
jgi:hypothetical protein